MENAQTFMAPGWYPDPTLPGQQRWWSGLEWTDFTQSADGTAPAAASTAAHATSADAYAMSYAGAPVKPKSERSLVEGNNIAFTALAVVGIYLYAGAQYGVYLTGFIPAFIAWESVKEREPLAPLAALVAGGALVFGIMRLLS